jgi:pimeloyl-ACP methyl ester carboxylesterase
MLEIDGCQLHVEGSGSGPGVLLVHGTAANLWGDLPAMLSSDHRVVNYDRRSFGRSVNAPLANLRRHTRDAAGVLESLDEGPSTVVGWSFGGLIALDLAATRPDLVSGLVIIEAPLFLKYRPRFDLVRGVVAAKFQAARGRPREGADRFLRWVLQRRGEGNDLDRLPVAWREAMLGNAAAILRELDSGTGEHELGKGALSDVRCPIRWLYGDRSARTFEDTARRAPSHFAQVTLVPVARAGHVVQFDRPDAVADAVRRVAVAARS